MSKREKGFLILYYTLYYILHYIIRLSCASHHIQCQLVRRGARHRGARREGSWNVPWNMFLEVRETRNEYCFDLSLMFYTAYMGWFV